MYIYIYFLLQDSLIRDILNSPLKSSTIDRIAASLYGQSRKPTKAVTLYEHLTLVLDTFEENEQNVSDLVDINDAQVYIYIYIYIYV